MHGHGLGAFGSLYGSFGSFHNAVALQSGDLHHLAAQLTGQLCHIDLVTGLAHHVHHVDGHHHRDAKLGKLRGQVKVALQVGTVDDVQNGIRALVDQVVTGHHFLQRIGRKGINAGQVHDDYVFMLFELALFLFHGNAGPVAHELVGPCQSIEQRGFSAVGIARQGDADLFVFHVFTLLFFALY